MPGHPPASFRLPSMLAVAAMALAPSSALAVPVKVLSRTNLDVSVVKRWDSLTVSGSLTDDGGSAVALAEVTLSVDRWDGGPRTALTDAAGRFVITLGPGDLDRLSAAVGSDPDVRLVVRYGGDSLRGDARTEQVIDLTRETLQLHAVVSPPRASPGRTPRILAALRHGADPASGLRLVAEVAGETLAATTNAGGRVTFRSLPDLPPGSYTVAVRFEGTDRFNPVAVTRDLTIEVRTSLTLARTDRGDDPLSVSVAGELRAGGQPLAGTVALVMDETAFGYARAGEDGRFHTTLDLTAAATAYGPRTMPLRAHYTPAETWELPALSAAVPVDVPAPPRVPILAYLLPLAALGLALAAGALIRSGALSRALRDLWDRVRRPRRARIRSMTDGRPVLEMDAGGGDVAEGDRLSGVVWDPHVDLPVEGATLSIVGTDGAAVRSGPGGAFLLGPLPPGRHTLQVTHDGYLGESLPVTIPHGGGRFRVRLTPVRAVTAAAYRRFVREYGPPGAHFGVQTPRELERLLTGRAPAGTGTLRELTLRFEAHYFGGSGRPVREDHQATLDLLGRARQPPEAP